jgi:hypothetical protein
MSETQDPIHGKGNNNRGRRKTELSKAIPKGEQQQGKKTRLGMGDVQTFVSKFVIALQRLF